MPGVNNTSVYIFCALCDTWPAPAGSTVRTCLPYLTAGAGEGPPLHRGPAAGCLREHVIYAVLIVYCVISCIVW